LSPNSSNLSFDRLGSLDWQFSNVTSDATYQFVGNWTELTDEEIHEKKIFEMRGKYAFTTAETLMPYMLTDF
jgi:hypothetical protein